MGSKENRDAATRALAIMANNRKAEQIKKEADKAKIKLDKEAEANETIQKVMDEEDKRKAAKIIKSGP